LRGRSSRSGHNRASRRGQPTVVGARGRSARVGPTAQGRPARRRVTGQFAGIRRNWQVTVANSGARGAGKPNAKARTWWRALCDARERPDGAGSALRWGGGDVETQRARHGARDSCCEGLKSGEDRRWGYPGTRGSWGGEAGAGEERRLASMADEGHEEEQPQVDIGWKHGVLIDAASKRVRCNHCGYFFNPRHQYSDSPHNDGEVLQGTINVIGRLSRSMDERIDAMIEMDIFKLKLDIYRDYDVKEAVTRMGPGSHWEQRFAEREALSSQIDVDELFDEEHPLNAWVETRQEMDVPEFDPRDCSWAEGELDGVEAGDPELRNIREAEEKDKGMDKGDMKDNNIMQPMSGHLGSQTIVQGLLIYLHFSLPFYRTQILVAHLMEYKEDGDLGLHKNKSLVALVKQQVHTNRLSGRSRIGQTSLGSIGSSIRSDPIQDRIDQGRSRSRSCLPCVKPKERSESSIGGSSPLDQIQAKADDKILQQLKSLSVNITVWE
ncbi:hypothetical protein Taro_001957, partial [Colocasia esculenta]|nr:hypothetical protein [Colocasia esculenta]